MFEVAIEALQSRIDFYQNQIDVDYVTLEGANHHRQKIKELQHAISVLEIESNKPKNIKGYHDVNKFYE